MSSINNLAIFFNSMPINDIPDLFEDDSSDLGFSTMDIPDLFEDDSMDLALSKMDLPDMFDDDSMDFHLSKMEIPQQGGNIDNEPSAKRIHDQNSTSQDIIFNVRLDKKLKPLVSKNLNAVEDTFVYQIDHNLHNFIDGIKNRNVESFAAIGPQIDAMFADLVEPHLKKMEANDVISIQVSHEALERDIYINYKRDNFKSTTFLDKISQLSQSDKTIFLNTGQLTIKITHYKGLRGSGRGRGSLSSRAPIQAKKYFSNKKSICKIDNTDHKCGYLAITLGKILADNPDIRKTNPSQWDSLVRSGKNVLPRKMEELFLQLNVNISQPMDLENLNNIQTKMADYQIIVIPRPTISTESKSKIYSGEFKNKRIILEYIEDDEYPNGHYNLVKSITGYYDMHFWCFNCWKGYENVGTHFCQHGCKRCGSNTICEPGVSDISCKQCHLIFSGQQCFKNHLEHCEKRKKCTTCELTFIPDKRFPHVCDKSICQTCHEQYSVQPHYCIIKPHDVEKLKAQDDENKIIVAFDIETRVAEVDEKGFAILQANLLVSHTVCDQCFVNNTSKTSTENCDICGSLENVYLGDDCVKRFIDYVCDDLPHRTLKKFMEKQNLPGADKKAKKPLSPKLYIYAHNLKSFDGRFILREIWSRKYKEVKPVFTGSKILKLQVGLCTFLDSLSFLQMPLSRVAKAFNLAEQKGDFPHHANKPENYGYIGPYFPIQDYAVEYMPSAKQNEFFKWHQSKIESQATFDFNHEFITYCRNDVIILLSAIMRFRELFKSVAKLDPTTRNFTLAAVGQETYRSRPMKSTIGIVPASGYLQTRNSSIGENLWLDWIQNKESISILRQQKIGPNFCDGMNAHDQNTIYEFNGCFYHGCLECYPQDRNKIIYQDGNNEHFTHNYRYRNYNKKKEYYAKRGFKLVEIWEHEFEEMVKNSSDPYLKERKSQLEKLKVLPKNVIRNSLFGGRTNNFKFQYDCEEGEKLLYVDFTSLYPFVLKCREYPCGHPQVITENFNYNIDDYFGFITCRIQPPKQLDLPCLPVKACGKLLFPLCRSCAEVQTNSFCTHSNQERAIEGTWTTPELSRAVKEGYVIEEILLVHNYQRETDDEKDLFADYINLWLQIKQQASGYPSWVKTPEDEDKYIEQYKNKENITLEKKEITKNPGKRNIAKLMLNSFWGKLAQRPNMPQTEIITDHKKLMDILCDEKIKITGDQLLNDHTSIISYEYIDVDNAKVGNTSPAIASFVTSYGRLCLYDLMTSIEKERKGRLLYCDTDSAVFVHRPGDKEIETGDYLGELTDEFASDYPGFTCYKGFFCGPKSYMLLLRKQDGDREILKTISKFKGLSLSSATEETITPVAISRLINDYIQDPIAEPERISVKQQAFSALKFQQQMRRKEFTKDFRVTSDKRIIRGNDTFPHGYVV